MNTCKQAHKNTCTHELYMHSHSALEHITNKYPVTGHWKPSLTLSRAVGRNYKDSFSIKTETVWAFEVSSGFKTVDNNQMPTGSPPDEGQIKGRSVVTGIEFGRRGCVVFRACVWVWFFFHFSSCLMPKSRTKDNTHASVETRELLTLSDWLHRPNGEVKDTRTAGVCTQRRKGTHDARKLKFLCFLHVQPEACQRKFKLEV